MFVFFVLPRHSQGRETFTWDTVQQPKCHLHQYSCAISSRPSCIWNSSWILLAIFFVQRPAWSASDLIVSNRRFLKYILLSLGLGFLLRGLEFLKSVSLEVWWIYHIWSPIQYICYCLDLLVLQFCSCLLVVFLAV